MRKIICASCGKIITVDSCTGQSCREMSCPDCGGRMVRDHSAGAKQNNIFTFGNSRGNTGRGMNQVSGMKQGRGMNQVRGRQGCGRSV